MKKEIGAFKGFTPETFKFFHDLKENNYKEWFEEHRQVYESELLLPFKAFVTEMAPAMYNIDARFELRPHRTLSRIYRDTRFSKNKDPYKTCMWCTFQPPVADWFNVPGFFLELTAEGYNYGLGLYMAKRKVMDDFRDRLEYEKDEFIENGHKVVLDRGFAVMGEDYKKKLPNELPEDLQCWYQKKSVYVWKEMPVGKEVFGTEFLDVIREDFQALEWLYNFMKVED